MPGIEKLTVRVSVPHLVVVRLYDSDTSHRFGHPMNEPVEPIENPVCDQSESLKMPFITLTGSVRGRQLALELPLIRPSTWADVDT